MSTRKDNKLIAERTSYKIALSVPTERACIASCDIPSNESMLGTGGAGVAVRAGRVPSGVAGAAFALAVGRLALFGEGVALFLGRVA